jgi:hypothetical protein
MSPPDKSGHRIRMAVGGHRTNLQGNSRIINIQGKKRVCCRAIPVMFGRFMETPCFNG